MRYICTSIVAMLALAGTSFAATINVPGDQPTIAAAISASVNGDVIAIAAGTYHEHSLNPNGKAITIGSASGNLDVTIDAQQGGSVFLINLGEGDGTVIKDLVLTGGNAWKGGGIYCYYSNPTITNCTISGNTATPYEGGGIACINSNPTITNCTIEGNTSGNSGGGIYCMGSSPTITNCTISDNAAPNGGGIYCRNNSTNDSSNPTITNCTISNNTAANGSGIYCIGSNPTISGGSVCANSPDQTYADSNSNINIPSGTFCWIAEICDGSPYIIIANQQEQINQLLTMHDQQQTAIEDLQQVVAECCAPRTCTGDENSDGLVNIDDVLIVLSAWGPCP